MEKSRIYRQNATSPDPDGHYVLYRIQVHRRFHWNHALDYAVDRAREHGKPLLLYEGLRCDYPWASDRFHGFILESMKEMTEEAEFYGVSYLPFIENEPGREKEIFHHLLDGAVEVISDEYPVFIMQEQNAEAANRSAVPYTTVDSNGVLPLDATEKAPYNAYFFRKVMQRNFKDSYPGSQKRSVE